MAIIGAGPIGLAAAANLVERGIDFIVFEAGDRIAASVQEWGHTRLFSPWKHLVDPASRRLLEERGWALPDPEQAPSGAELVRRYLVPLAALPEISSRVRLGVEVIGLAREGMDRTRTRSRAATPFTVRTRDRQGKIEDVAARSVIDASGTYRSPNPLSASGLALRGCPRSRNASSPPSPMCSAVTGRCSPEHTPQSSAPATRPPTPFWGWWSLRAARRAANRAPRSPG
ncbi:NAD(P)-binding domain-containing protein [Microbacterium elymi]|uniref:NAD(P)-binding domain-containing protein n=1 Tax=Microbacterium elymi TaxID=2909587 RepID=A0ABY5NLP9_9MICO|nr:NAD(P)-binding domain-containing protein [Microbacterium elymi]UUT36070.1 NAD(P)-binding domain-containing protein [Microbacterium elymi]